MPEFNVQITETLTKTVTVEAETQDAANWIAEQNWHKGDYILDADNFTGVVFEGASRVPEKDLRLKPGFKDGEIYDKFPDQVCYVPEYWNFDEDGPGITANDILEMCDGDKLKAGLVFDLCEWEHPNTVLARWDEDDDRALAELRAQQDGKQQFEELTAYLHGLYIDTGDFQIQQAADLIEDLRDEVDHYIGVQQEYQEKYQKAKRLCQGLADMLDGVDLATIERLVYEGHDLDMACELFSCDPADFDENGKYLRNKEGVSQPLNQQIQNAADRAGEGANSAPPKDKSR